MLQNVTWLVVVAVHTEENESLKICGDLMTGDTLLNDPLHPPKRFLEGGGTPSPPTRDGGWRGGGTRVHLFWVE